ncbi:hypothetical protein PIB30_042395 [Stylosanthes scabra]|uniref:Uncharacterized protein n=1 Tax=Stylosanthes scabra TaxID=79078 RepID=A0ABU6XGY4_9FABA|nr:hypothetical protein [Stylosanthes scabra]
MKTKSIRLRAPSRLHLQDFSGSKLRSALKLIKHVRDLVDRFRGVTYEAVFQVYVKEVGADFLTFQVHPEEDPTPICSCSACDLPGTMEVEKIPSEVKETPIVHEGNEETDGALQFSTMSVQKNGSEEFIGNSQDKRSELKLFMPVPPGFDPCKEGVHIHRELERVEEKGLEENGDSLASFEALGKSDEADTLDHELKETKDATKEAAMKEDKDIKEDRRTVQICQKGGLTFKEDDDVVLTTLKKKRKNKDKGQQNISKGNKPTTNVVGLKHSRRLLR